VDGAGNAVSVDEMMKQFGDQGSYGGKADALEAFGRQYDLLAYTKGASSEDSIREERGRAIAAQKALGGGLQKRVGKRGFLGSLMDGLLAGADGQISQGALVGVASEQAGKKGEFKDTRTATFGRDRDGNYTDVTADKLRKLMGAEGAEAFATEAGGSLEDLVSRIGKGDKAAQDALDAKINGGDYVADYLNGDNLTVVDRESYETAENSFSAKGRRAAAARLLGKDQKLKDKFMEGTDLGSDILSGISSNGLLGNLTGDNDGKYKDYAAGRLQELEEVSGGELGKSLETAIASAKAKLVNAKTSKEEKKSAQASLEKYQAAQLALGKDAAKGDNAVMENVIIKVAHFEESINKGN
jgi:hypothetical protein